MTHHSVLDSWLGNEAKSKHKFQRQTNLDGWIQHIAIAIPNTECDSDDQQGQDLYKNMPALISDSDNSSIDSDSDVPGSMLTPSDGYLWNLVPAVNNQYLDLSIMHPVSSGSNSPESNESDDSFVCEDEVPYTAEEALLLQQMFPKTAHKYI